eukprot:PLAT3286.7.p1 GENE.PLAT3286.7~~PLAT3286.7.p1  ORF type:complete len:211 (+),score=113.51 PLAT3286.7:65-634(+)
MQSAKVQKLAKLLPQLVHEEDRRVLLFSQFTIMLDVLELVMDRLGFEYRRFDGSTPVSERQQLVDEFQTDDSIKVLLLSTRAAGQGVNLTAASAVILHDMDFNPQMDRQAQDRCHRIGQTREVKVFKLYTKGTVEETILASAKRKVDVDRAVMGQLEGGGSAAAGGSAGDSSGKSAVCSMMLGILQKAR